MFEDQLQGGCETTLQHILYFPNTRGCSIPYPVLKSASSVSSASFVTLCLPNSSAFCLLAKCTMQTMAD